ncbi:OmpA family protein [Luteimonas sp. A478]
MWNRNMIRRSLALALLPLCAAALHATDLVVPAGADVPIQGVVGETEFPDVDRAWLRGGDFVNVDNLRQIGRGMSKNQIRSLLGNPHFSEGIGGVSRWDYVFNFRTGVDTHVTCQYQLNYERPERRYLVESIHWDGPACLDVLNAAPAPVAVAPEPVVHTLSADALFAFDRSGVRDILPEGQKEVAELAASLSGDDQVRISVVGHADRLGNADYNQRLSEQRANTVRDLLVQDGIPAASITASGRGSTQPVTSCDAGLGRDALVACLRPDRRVEIEVSGQR